MNGKLSEEPSGLFNMYTYGVVRKMKAELGNNWVKMKLLVTWHSGESEKELQRVVSVFNAVRERLNLRMNAGKNEVMLVERNPVT